MGGGGDPKMIVAFAFGIIVYTKEYNFDFLKAYLQEMAYSFEKLFCNFLKVPSGQIGSAWEWYHWKAL